VTIDSTHVNGSIRLTVRDNGIGVQPEDQGTLFKPFERLHSHQEYPGSGLGLALVARGAERMGGRVGMHSNGVDGSAFWIDLPAVSQEDLSVTGASR
jgi:signal transduction histidine kinase